VSSEVVMSKDARMLHFVTPTEEWAQRACNPISVPAEWPLMLHCRRRRGPDDVHRGCSEELYKSVLRSRIYVYQFRELPEAIIEVLDRHFVQVEEDLRSKLDSLLPTFTPTLSSLRSESRLCLDQVGVVVPKILSCCCASSDRASRSPSAVLRLVRYAPK